MKLVDDIYNLYKDQLVGDEEDAVIIISGLLEELERDQMLEWVRDLNRYELFEMLGSFLVDRLKRKLSEDGLGNHDGDIPVAEDVH